MTTDWFELKGTEGTYVMQVPGGLLFKEYVYDGERRVNVGLAFVQCPHLDAAAYTKEHGLL